MMEQSGGPQILIEMVTVIMVIVWIPRDDEGVDESAVASHVTINGDIDFFLSNIG
jgi:hypothetical protein